MGEAGETGLWRRFYAIVGEYRVGIRGCGIDVTVRCRSRKTERIGNFRFHVVIPYAKAVVGCKHGLSAG